MAANKQKDRQQRGDDFQDEIRRSWKLVRSWRMRVADGKGGSRPADEIVILEVVNILAEMKRTEGDRFELSFLRPNQITGLLAFDKVFEQNYGMVFVSFLNEEAGIDEAYAVNLPVAINFMRQQKRKYITLEEFRTGAVKNKPLTRETVDGEPGYDLRGLQTCYKYV